MSRYCPNCGAVVPENSLNCPQCYTDIPRGGYVNERDHMREHRTKEDFVSQIEKRHKKRSLALLLAIIPAFFGILGLGQIYLDRRYARGYMYLATGLLFFLSAVGLFVLGSGHGWATVILFIPIFISMFLYFLTAVASVAETWLGSFRVFGLRYS